MIRVARTAVTVLFSHGQFEGLVGLCVAVAVDLLPLSVVVVDSSSGFKSLLYLCFRVRSEREARGDQANVIVGGCLGRLW